ncbi:PAS domain S-box protein [Lichenicoccus sp.]|uniref:PAS domain S-box protein n=1 Tax=Lichenicoccus sp. TaxID=2781899 RepID=UPI003D0D9147
MSDSQTRDDALSRRILDSAIDYAIISFDLNGLVTSWNDGARRILGWSEAEMLGTSAERLFTPEDVAAGVPESEMGNALRHGRGNDERWHVKRDGVRFWASGEMMALRDDAGAIDGFIKIMRDRTEQRMAVRALRESRERIETALDTGLVGFFDWDVPSGLMRGDASFATFHGVDPQVAEDGIPIRDLVGHLHPDDRIRARETVRRSQTGIDDYSEQFRVRQRDGETRWILVRGRCYERDGHRARRYTGITIDITASRSAEQALQASEEFNRRILASSNDCIKVLDLEGRLLFISDGGMRALEIDDLASVAGCFWPNFWRHEENRDARMAVETARLGGVGRFNGYADTMKGVSRYWDVVVTPMLGADGQPEKLLAISRDITEQRQASERIELALEAGAVIGTFLWDVSADRLSGDSRFARIFAMDPAVLARGLPLSSILDAIHPDDHAEVESRIAEAVAAGSRYRAEYRVRQHDGAWLWVEANGNCEQDASGAPRRFPGILFDIDGRKRHALRQAAELELGDRLRDVRDTAAMAEILAEVLGRTLNVRRAGYGRLDRNRRDLIIEGDWCADASISSAAGRHRFSTYGKFLDDLLRGEIVAIPDVGEDPRTRAHAASLRELQIESLLNVPLMERGQLVAVLFLHDTLTRSWSVAEIAFIRTIVDRTWAAAQRVRAEADLRRLNETLEAEVGERTRERDLVWRVSPDLFVACGHDGRLCSVNPAWTEALGYAAAELLGLRFDALLHPDDLASTRAALERLRGGEPVRDLDTRVRARSGSYRWYSWTCLADGDEFYAAGRDMTARKSLEEQLRQSQKMEAVGQLTGGLAHDFNNLLTGIVGSLELLQTRIDQGRVGDLARYVNAAQGAANRAAALTHRLLAFSRRQTLDPRTVDADALVDGIEELIRRTVGPGIDLLVVKTPDLWSTLCDPNQLENALLNLCINARDAMPGGGRLTIETANRLVDPYAAHMRDLVAGRYVALSVTDTGAGMPPEVVERAFDPFFTTKPLGQGTGLGLSMIYGFVKQSGGQIRIHSTVGDGTGVTLYLPCHDGAADADAAAAALAEAPRASDGETVLVVDDEPTVRMLVVEVLSELGYRAVEASDGPSGLRILQSGRSIDLLVTDVGLPGGMNGRQLADAARVGSPALKVLFITGYAENAVVGRGMLEPGMQIMSKPFSMESLATRIREILTQG